MPKYVGDVVIKVDGTLWDIIDGDYESDTGRKTFDLMTQQPQVNTYQTASKVTGSINVAIPLGKTEPKWEEIEDAKILFLTADGEWSEAIDQVGVESVSGKFSAGQQAQRTIQFHGIMGTQGGK